MVPLTGKMGIERCPLDLEGLVALGEVRMEATWNELKGELERELHSSPWGFCYKFKSRKLKRQNLSNVIMRLCI